MRQTVRQHVTVNQGRPVGRLNLRKFWLQIHLWLGLVLGTFLSLIAITGAALVFYQEIDVALNPELRIVTPTPEGIAAWRPLEEIAETARRAIPANSRPGFVYYPADERQSFMFFYQVKNAETGLSDTKNVFIDPYTGHVLGSRVFYSSRSVFDYCLIGFLFKLHYSLLLHETGKTIVGVMAVLAFVSTVTGIIIWWPKNNRWRGAFTLKWPAKSERLHFDLHRLAGFYLTPVALCILLSGVFFNLPNQFRVTVELFSRLTKIEELVSRPEGDAVLTLDAALDAAMSRYPQGRMYALTMPKDDNAPYVIHQLFPIGWGLQGRRAIYVDRFNGSLMHVRDPLSGDGDGFITWQWPLHSGYVLGWPGRIAVFLFGLSWPLMFYTGVIRWLHKRRAKRIHNERASVARSFAEVHRHR
jgi:uncharacterized iron-regulated membrane protein